MADNPFRGFRITSDPDATAIEQPEKDPARPVNPLPLRLLLVSDLAPQATVEQWSEGNRVCRVDKHRLAGVMQDMAPRLQIDVPNCISEAPKTLEVDLRFAALKDFRPEGVARQVPPLAQLVQVRALIQALRQGAIDPEAFQTRLGAAGLDAGQVKSLAEALSVSSSSPRPAQAPSSPNAAFPKTSSPNDDEALDRLLGLVDLDEDDAKRSEDPTPAPASYGALSALVDAAAGASPAQRVERPAAEALLADLDRLTGDQLGAVFSHPAFRKLEAAWCGLEFLVDRLDFRKNIQLDVLAASKGDLSEALYHQVLMPEHASDAERPPISAVVLDFAFDHGAADMERLQDLAETGASLQAPLIASAAPAFFGVAGHSGLARLPVLRQHLDGPAYTLWNKLRGRSEARHLTLALPSFALRYPYGGDHYGPQRPAGALFFDEEGVLWGGAALAVAAALAASFARSGWPTHLARETVENLPAVETDGAHTPLAALIPDAKQEELAEAGFAVLSGRPDHDALHVAQARTVGRPASYEDVIAAREALVHVTLACQLFAARAAHALLRIQQDVCAPGKGLAQVEEEIRTSLLAFLGTEGESVPEGAVEVRCVEAGRAGREVLAVRLQPPPFVLDQEVSLVMRVQGASVH